MHVLSANHQHAGGSLLEVLLYLFRNAPFLLEGRAGRGRARRRAYFFFVRTPSIRLKNRPAIGKTVLLPVCCNWPASEGHIILGYGLL